MTRAGCAAEGGGSRLSSCRACGRRRRRPSTIGIVNAGRIDISVEVSVVYVHIVHINVPVDVYVVVIDVPADIVLVGNIVVVNVAIDHGSVVPNRAVSVVDVIAVVPMDDRCRMRYPSGAAPTVVVHGMRIPVAIVIEPGADQQSGGKRDCRSCYNGTCRRSG